MQFMEFIGWLIVNFVHAVHVHSSYTVVHVRVHVRVNVRVHFAHVIHVVDVVHIPNVLFMLFI